MRAKLLPEIRNEVPYCSAAVWFGDKEAHLHCKQLPVIDHGSGLDYMKLWHAFLFELNIPEITVACSHFWTGSSRFVEESAEPSDMAN